MGNCCKCDKTVGCCLDAKAKNIRRDIVEMIAAAKSGHPGGSLSAVEMLVALYFGGGMNHDVNNPSDDSRDRFIMSKGHAVPALYATLAEAGYIDKTQLNTLRQLGSPLQGHPSKVDLSIMEASTGSLGQGLSVGIGIAIAGKLNKLPYRVYVMVGDGEAEEGQIWEAVMSAPSHELDNLVMILDWNKYQLDGSIEDILDWQPIPDKFKAFGWNVIEINGQDIEECIKALEEAKTVKGNPTCIVSSTTKGAGVSFISGNNDWHGKAPSAEECEKALQELK